MDFTGATHLLHKVAHGQALFDIGSGVMLAPWINGLRPFFDSFRGQGDVRGDYQIARFEVLHNVVVGDIKTPATWMLLIQGDRGTVRR